MKKKQVIVWIVAVLVLALSLGWSGKTITYGAADTFYSNNIMNVVVASSDGNCSFRTGPGLSYEVRQLIYNGTLLHITGVTQNSADGLVWGQTTYNGFTGWISMMLTIVNDVENSSKASYDVTVTAPEYIVMRRGPGAEYDALYYPYEGQVLRIYETVANSFDGRPWGRTSVNGMDGWVSLNWTTRNESWTYNQSRDVTFYNNVYNVVVQSPDGFANLRTGPGTSYPVIQPLYNGTSLKVTAALDNSSEDLVWGQTVSNGVSGWVSMGLTRVTNLDNASLAGYYVTVTDSDNIRLRRGPGAEYEELVSYIPSGTSLYIRQTVINSFDGRPWGKTYVNGMEGWISLNRTYRAPGQ